MFFLNKKYFFFLLHFFFLAQAFSQHKLSVVNLDNSVVFGKLNFQKDHISKINVVKEVKKLVASLQAQGYLFCSADSILSDSLNHKLFLSIGKQFSLVKLKKGNTDENIFSEINYNEKFFTNKVFKTSEISKLVNKILVYYENHGYPFATVKFDSVLVTASTISLSLNVSKNKMISIDSLLVLGDLKVSKSFLHHYFQVKQGGLYNEEAIRNISQKLKQLPFAKEVKPIIVKLTDKSNKIYFFVSKKNASQFDGIIGLLPSQTGKTIFTGDVKVKLINTVFKSGETIELNWRRLQSQTQDLQTHIIYPYIFNSFIGTEHSLKLYRRDTTFIDVQNNIAAQYLFNGLNNFKCFYRQRNSNLLSTSALIGLTSLPDYADITTRSYGLGFFYEKLDYNFNPRSGVSVNFNGSVGTRTITKNNKLNDVVYNGLKLNTSQYQIDACFLGFIPILKKSTIKIAARAATVMSQQIFKNELFRIGGLKTLRGFDEESIFASSFVVGTLEYRYLLEENSAIFLFTDGAWYEKSSVNSYINDLPIGVGAGISFETKAGIFSLTYALGSQFGNGFDIRSGKIHFGIVNSF